MSTTVYMTLGTFLQLTHINSTMSDAANDIDDIIDAYSSM